MQQLVDLAATVCGIINMVIWSLVLGLVATALLVCASAIASSRRVVTPSRLEALEGKVLRQRKARKVRV